VRNAWIPFSFVYDKEGNPCLCLTKSFGSAVSDAQAENICAMIREK